MFLCILYSLWEHLIVGILYVDSFIWCSSSPVSYHPEWNDHRIDVIPWSERSANIAPDGDKNECWFCFCSVDQSQRTEMTFCLAGYLAVWLSDWMAGLGTGWLAGCLAKGMNGYTDEWVNFCMGHLFIDWLDWWIDGWIDRSTNGWIGALQIFRVTHCVAHFAGRLVDL